MMFKILMIKLNKNTNHKSKIQMINKSKTINYFNSIKMKVMFHKIPLIKTNNMMNKNNRMSNSKYSLNN